MIFPIGVENAAVDRVPYVSICIALLNVMVFASTCGPRSVDEELANQRIESLVEYHAQHPYLQVPTDCVRIVERRDVPVVTVSEQPTSPAARRDEQSRINHLCAQVYAVFTRPEFAKWGLTPARGIFRPGLVTHLFLHADLFHLLGNLLFFYIVALLLEDIWGRLMFPVFYVVAGVLAGLSQALLDTTSSIPIIGASGAIAACMGAFTFRFATRRIKMAYWFWLFLRGTFFIPAWLWGGLWFASEVYSWRSGTAGSVAVMAHIGGFVVGFATALLIKLSGFEHKVLTPHVAGLGPHKEMSAELIAGNKAFDSGNLAQARQAYRRAVEKDPSDKEAWLGLARVGVHASDAIGLHKALDRLVALSTTDEAALNELLDEFSALLQPALCAPSTAQRLARFLERKHPPTALALYEAAGSGEGDVAALSLLRHAELVLVDNPTRAGQLAQLAMAKNAPSRDISVRANAILQRVAPTRTAPVPARFTGRSPQGWTIQTLDGRTAILQPVHIRVVGAAIVGQALITDLMLPAVTLRCDGTSMGLEALYPGHPLPDAHRGLMNELAHANVRLWPSTEALIAGRYPSLPSAEALEQALQHA